MPASESCEQNLSRLDRMAGAAGAIRPAPRSRQICTRRAQPNQGIVVTAEIVALSDEHRKEERTPTSDNDSPFGAERRRFDRRALLLRVDYADRAAYVSSWTENVSAGGLFVRTSERFREGEVVHLVLSFPGLLAPVEVEGTVAWVRSPDGGNSAGIGVRVDDERCRRVLAELALSTRPENSLPQRYRVLVAEDNPHIARSYERVLKRATALAGCTFETTMVANGHEAMLYATANPVDLIITDLYMPVMDGLALTTALRADPSTRNTRIVCVTSGAESEQLALQKAGVDAVLPKPFQFTQILETIACLLWLRGPQGSP
jgi:uncharacterized protein (TIGR02266 family)